MSDRLLHLVRHGEVANPDGVLYGCLPGFGLSDRGYRMAEAAALELRGSDRPVARLIASPLLRAQQSAGPISELLGVEIETDDRIIEPTNAFEGAVNSGKRSAFKNPRYWYRFYNPFRPSWGEPYRTIARRVRAAMDDAWAEAEAKRATGDIVMVSHQAVIWAAHRDVAGEPLFHNPAKRRCALSSITSFERRSGRWVEVDYRSPAEDLLEGSIDVGAV